MHGGGRMEGDIREETSYINQMEEYRKNEIEVLNRLNFEEIDIAIGAIRLVWEKRGTIYICGNGGSAATASHYANDFNKGIFEKTGRKFRMHCLCDNIATIMAIANDIGYDEVFRFQLNDILREGDLVIGISGSGNSTNVINAIAYAKERGIKTIAITGYDGGKLREMADYKMHVPIDNMKIAEDIHMFFDHMIMHVLCVQNARIS